MNNKDRKQREALEFICSAMNITIGEADFYGTYNPMAYYEQIVDKKVPQHEAKKLMEEYQPVYDKISKLVGKYNGKQ